MGEVCPFRRTTETWKTTYWTEKTVIALYKAVAAFFVRKQRRLQMECHRAT